MAYLLFQTYISWHETAPAAKPEWWSTHPQLRIALRMQNFLEAKRTGSEFLFFPKRQWFDQLIPYGWIQGSARNARKGYKKSGAKYLRRYLGSIGNGQLCQLVFWVAGGLGFGFRDTSPSNNPCHKGIIGIPNNQFTISWFEVGHGDAGRYLRSW